ncbi:hypothetical protein BDR03DRAFT_978110 [Suillus americanus]|nr:hypothetical protein BDR03DRAFT_978110 [Suillus americanus]
MPGNFCLSDYDNSNSDVAEPKRLVSNPSKSALNSPIARPIAGNFSLGGSEGEGETYSPLPHHSLCLPGQSCATYAPNFGMGGLEREEEKTHSSLPLHFSRLPGQNCSTHNRKVQFGWLRGGGEVIHPHLFFIATPDLHPLPSYFTGPRLAPAPLFLPAGSKLRDLCPNKHSTLGALEQEEEKHTFKNSMLQPTSASLKLIVLKPTGRVLTWSGAITATDFAHELANYGECLTLAWGTRVLEYAKTIFDLTHAPLCPDGKILIIGSVPSRNARLPQKNVIFPELSCYQTLHCTLSGGQKCKLQLAIGLIGGSKIVLVDECTSGVDPLSCRALWKTLTSVRFDRTIVFTTHFLDEADLLADKIAILAAPGKLVAEGTPVALKSNLEQGYSVQVMFDSPDLAEKNLPTETLDRIRQICPQCSIIFAVTTNQFSGLGFFCLVLVLYGIVGTLFAYCVSLFMSSPLSSSAAGAGYQIVMYIVIVYLGGDLLTPTYALLSQSGAMIRISHKALPYTSLSPLASVIHAAFVSVNLFSLLCDGTTPVTMASLGDILRYGGPIIYLIVYGCILIPRRFLNTKGRQVREWINRQDVAAETFGSNKVVDDVSCGVSRGTIFAMLGPNGAGKTTTFNKICGDIVPDMGDVLIKGVSLLTSPRTAHQLIWVKHSELISPHASGQEATTSCVR